MGRFIIRYSGPCSVPPENIEELLSSNKLSILDQSPRMYLIQGKKEDVERVAENLPYWTVSPERIYRVPDQGPKLRS
jgi:hypothetical protein